MGDIDLEESQHEAMEREAQRVNYAHSALDHAIKELGPIACGKYILDAMEKNPSVNLEEPPF